MYFMSDFSNFQRKSCFDKNQCVKAECKVFSLEKVEGLLRFAHYSVFKLIFRQ